MANLTIELPDNLAQRLEKLAAAQRKSVQQLALEKLSLLVEAAPNTLAGSPVELLRVMREGPRLSTEDVDALEASIASGRLPIQTPDLFSE
jgi:hypothetical protein